MHDVWCCSMWLVLLVMFLLVSLFSETWLQELPEYLPSQCYYSPFEHSVSLKLMSWEGGREPISFDCMNEAR